MYAFAAGLIIGFVLAIPPGPVAVTSMRVAFTKGLKHATSVGFGNGVMDFTFASVFLFATSAMKEGLNGFADESPAIWLALQIAIVTGIVVFGIYNLRMKKSALNFDPDSSDDRIGRLFHALASKGPFFLGIAIALTNIFNPAFLPTLAAISAGAHKYILTDPNAPATAYVMFAFGFGVGNFSWLYLLVRLALKFREKVSEATMVRVHKIAGAVLILFGAVLGYKIYAATEWSEVLLRLQF